MWLTFHNICGKIIHIICEQFVFSLAKTEVKVKKTKQTLSVKQRMWVTGSSRLADRLGCTRTHMSMILHGTRRPGKRLAAAMRRLGVEWPVAGLAEGGAE